MDEFNAAVPVLCHCISRIAFMTYLTRGSLLNNTIGNEYQTFCLIYQISEWSERDVGAIQHGDSIKECSKETYTPRSPILRFHDVARSGSGRGRQFGYHVYV